MSLEVSHLKSIKVKWPFIAVIGVLLFMAVWLGTYGINKTIDKTISVDVQRRDVYEDDDWSNITSSIKIAGNLRKTLFSTSFVGTFAIEYYEPSCRDGVEVKIDWQGNDYQNISFYYAGNFSRLDVQKIDIDKDMNSMMIILKDGTIIASPDYYISTKIRNEYKG